MANKKKPNNKQPVNRVRRKADEQDITLGQGRGLPEDERHSIHKQGNKLETTHHRRVPLGEDTPLRKGRAPAKEKVKTPVDRHRPRKSEIEKEYTKELQKLRNRLRYREKQGFFVKWETLPSRPANITPSDIERLHQYQINLNGNGEIFLRRTEYSEQARQLRVSYTDLPNYTVENDPNFVPPMETVQNFDVFERIDSAFTLAISIVHTEGTQLDHPINEEKWVELSNDIELGLKDLQSQFRSQRDSPRRQEYAEYLLHHEDEITTLIDVYIHVSDSEQAGEVHQELSRYIIMH